MASGNVFRWLRDSSSKLCHGRRPRQQLPVKLSLEYLEPRLAPATFAVQHFNDFVTDPGSLRYALAHLDTGTAANTNTINIGLVDNFPPAQPILETAADGGGLTITQGVTINVVFGGVTIDGGNAFTVFTINSGVDAVLNGLTITHGNNTASNGTGGGLVNHGTLTINDSTLLDNSASGSGGGVYNDGALTVSDSTFSGNTSGSEGGGLFTSGGTATISDSTFSGNTAFLLAGGIAHTNSGLLTLNGNIIVGNTSNPGAADDIFDGAGTSSNSNNVVGADFSDNLGNGVNGNQVGVTPAQVALVPLAYNGGPTQTFALLHGSVAIGMGQTGVDPTDQRGDPRPATTRADAGAFQTQGNPPIYAFAQPDTTDRGVAFTGLSAQERYVQAIYLDELGRVGAKSELDGWVTVLNGPGGAAAVAGAIDHSFEARDHLVQSWYLSYLNRQAVGGEELGWVNLLMSGQTEEQVLSQILGSAEFYNDAQTRIGGANAQQNYVQALYQVLLNRTGEPGGASGFVNALPQAGTQGVALDFLQSTEFRTGDVEAYYNVLLHRPADPVGLNGWVFSNLDVGSVRVAFEATSEFFTNG